jgi:phosphomannomutase/phosphoglucomutase
VPKRSLALGLVLLALLGASKLLLGVWESHREAQSAAEEQTHAAEARRHAGELGRLLLDARAALDRHAEDPRVVSALAAGDRAAAAALGDELARGLPGALRLRLLPTGIVEPDASQSPPLTYPAIDLLRQAADAEGAVSAELHLAGTPDEHIALVRRVPPAGAPVGFLHLALAPGLLRDAVAALDTHGLAVELRQAVPGAPPLVIARRGAGGTDIAQASVPGSVWQLVLRRAGDGEVAEGLGVGRYALPAGGLALAVMALAFLWRRPRAADAGDTAPVTDFQGAIRAILAGELPGLEAMLPGGPVPEVPRTQAPAPAPVSAPRATPARPATPVPAAADTTVVMQAPPVAAPAVAAVDPVIFRSYDIRGVVDRQLTSAAVTQIGLAIGAEAAAHGQQTVVVARDGRLSSVALHEALVQGLLASGRDVIDIGLTPTPVLYFATHYLDTRTGVMITGSHNPPEYNGLKIVMDGRALSGDAIQAIRRRVEQQDYTQGQGTLQHLEIVPDYIQRVGEEIPISLGRELKVVVDCGNGVPGIVAPHVLRAIGHDVIELYCDVDGEFPNHHPDPSEPANLEDLILLVRHEDADLGLAFDGDGDRLGVVDRTGNIIWADRQLMLFARDVLSRNPGAKVIYDVKCSRHLAEVIREAGGEPLMWKTGHSLIKAKMAETGALLGGEMSGHLCFRERWYGFDDALYAAARLLEILVNADVPPEQVFASLPGGLATPELRIDMPESRHAGFMSALMAAADFPDATVTDIDGLRVDFADSFGLVRPSNTTPSIVLRFEGDDAAALERVQARFRDLLLATDASLELPF